MFSLFPYEEFEPEKGADEVGPGFWGIIARFFTEQFRAVWAGFIDVAPKAAEATWWTIYRLADEHTKTTINWAFDFLKSLGIMDQDDLDSFSAVSKLPWPMNIILTMIVVMVLFMGYLKTKMFAMLGTLNQRLNVIHSPNPPRPEEVMQAAFVAPEKTGEVRGAMKRSGLSDDDIDLVFLGAYRLYDENMIRILWLRGVLNDDQMYMRMRELGYTDARTKEMIQSWPIIPGPQDLFHLVAREAFEPEAISLMGLGDEFPAEQVEWLRKQGISEEWAKKYWYAHWDQPSIGHGFEMLHRQVIDKKALDMLFKTVEIPPFWRDKLTKIAYNPYTRVDVRRMHDMGVLTDEELIKSYQDQGYDEEHATKMGEFTIRYNASKEKDLTRGQILEGYRERVINKEDAKDLLMQTDYKEAQADYYIQFEDYKYTRDLQRAMIKNVGDRFVENLLNEAETRSRLTQLNLLGEEIDVLMDKWQIQRYTDRKIPSKSDLEKLLRTNIINEDQYKLEMQKLGYGWEYIMWYLEAVKLKK